MSIPIIIPTGYTYSCTVSGSTFKIVECEHCRFVFVYRMTRTGAGSATDQFFLNPMASDLAGMQAHYQLEQKLQDDCDAIPCLECGKYQSNMVSALKKDFQLDHVTFAQWMFVIAILAGIIAVLLVFTTFRTPQLLTITVPVGGFAALLGIIGFVALRRRNAALAVFDPHATPLPERMTIASTYAKTVEDFRAYLQGMGITMELPKFEPAKHSSSAIKRGRAQL